jgi:hypothetical protein
LKLLEEMRAVQAYLTALADGETPPTMATEPPNLATFVASLSSAWRDGEVRPTFSLNAKPRYLRGLQTIAVPVPQPQPQKLATSETQMAVAKMAAKLQRKPRPDYAAPGNARIQALRMAWPIVACRLEGMPNISAMQLFDELCIQFPGRFTPRQYPALLRRVNRWREDARERGVSVGTKTYRVFNDKWSGRKRDIFANHWTEMVECLEEHPDQTALELLVEFQVRYPGRYSQRQLHTLQKRVRAWRQQAVQRLINEVSRTPSHAAVEACR